jgi:hypothetical protein
MGFTSHDIKHMNGTMASVGDNKTAGFISATKCHLSREVARRVYKLELE